jgi:hypothetical protein
VAQRRVVVLVLVVRAQVVEAAISLVEIVRHVVVAVAMGQRLVIMLLETFLIRHRFLSGGCRLDFPRLYPGDWQVNPAIVGRLSWIGATPGKVPAP